MDQSHRWSIAPRRYAGHASCFGGTTQSDDPGPEQDYPMDAFDRQLLADSSTVHIQTEADSMRHSLPYHQRLPLEDGPDQRSTGTGLLDVCYFSGSSPSMTAPASSPTVTALQRKGQTSGQFQAHAFKDQPNIPRKAQKHPTSNRTGRRHWMAPITSSNPTHAPPTIQGFPLVPTDRLPDHMRSVFNFEIFNAVQSRCFSSAFESSDNLVVCAPTGSGKTAIMELALCRLLATDKKRDFKVVYQAPTKSLCSERCRDWTAKFDTLGLKCAELTGDVEYTHLRSVQSAHIIVTTPEKWDSVTRRWSDNAKLMQMVKLFLIDEVHILNEIRGATLEAVVSRMKSVGSAVRFIALSATVPNSEDIATWLGRNSNAQHLPAHREVFGEEFRPVKLEKHVIGYHCRPNAFALDSILMKDIPSILARYAKRKPVMIFCVTKSSAAKTASTLAELWESTAASLKLWNAPKQRIKVKNLDLQKSLSAGVAFHHGGLDYDDRRSVEQGFLSGNINIVCSTLTLAVGINLPCYLVILKGTSCWSDSGLQEYSSLEVMQMLGRAGRPQYETSACAVILTQDEKVRRYEEMVSGQEILESSLHKNLIEHLNAEIGIGTIHDTSSAKKWLSSSFLSVRLRKNPNHYHLGGSTVADDPEKILEQICERDVKLLESAELIEHRNGLRCTKIGEAMTRYYVEYESMLAFLKLPSKPKISEILNTIAQAHEFRDLRIRAGEKAIYKEINRSNEIRFPIKVDIALPAHKVSLIIQAQLGGVMLEKSQAKQAGQFKQDTLMVMNQCNRLIRCIIDTQIYREDATAVKNSLELCRSLAAGVWDNTPMQLKQIESVGDVTARKLAAAGIRCVDDLMNTEAQRIELILGKSQLFGDMLLTRAAKFPTLRISIKQVGSAKKAPSKGAEISLRCEIGYLNESLPIFYNRKAVYICFLCETSNGKLLDFRRFSSSRLKNGKQILLTVQLDQPSSFIDCHVACDETAGTHRQAQLKIDVPSSWFPRIQNHVGVITAGFGERYCEQYRSEDFDDTDLTNDDFLKAASHINEISISDADNNCTPKGQAEEPRRLNGVKRKASSEIIHEARDLASKVFREPKQLPNGNWTCQHTCNDEGKVCKHPCCKVGVKRPKKRGKTLTKVPVLPSVGQDTVSMSTTKKASKLDPDKSHSINDLLRIGSGDATTDDALPELGSIHDQQTKSRSSTNPIGFGTNEQVTDIDELVSDDLPSTQALLSNRGSKKSQNLRKQYTTESDDHEIFDAGDFDIDVEDCDWNCFSNESANASARDQNITTELLFPEIPARSNNVEDNRRLPEVSTTVDFGDTSSEETFFASPREAIPEIVYDVGNPNKGRKLKDNINDCESTKNNELPTLNGIEQLGEGAANDHVLPITHTKMMPKPQVQSQSDSKNDNNVRELLVEETEAEKQKRLHEESQKAKWAKFPAWMYEQFGAYADII